MQKILAELKRRQMFRVAAAYAVVSWLLLQIVNNVAPVLDLPVWVARAFLLALVIGFPIALLFVWMRDLAPADASAPKPATTKLDYVLAGGLILVIALLSYQQLAPTNAVRREASVVAAGAPVSGGISIAVLPFANVSGDATQEFFSDGMSDEIIAALAKIPSLQVVARTSAFQFKGARSDMRAIGQALNARYLIDGAVRRAGNRVRITAQLVQADNGVGVWTDSYDRELTDVFAIQEDIAEAIAGALRVPLGLQQGDNLVRERTSDLESYDQYLRAKVLLRARGPEVAQAITILEQVVARNPSFAPAWGLLAQAYVSLPNFNPVGSSEKRQELAVSSNAKTETAAREAIRLDPGNAMAIGALARLQARLGRFERAEELYGQALGLDPAEPEILFNYSVSLSTRGYLRQALNVGQKLRTLEPFLGNYSFVTAMNMASIGQVDAGIAILESFPTDAAGGFFRNSFLAQAYAAQGRYAEAADTLLAIPEPSLVGRPMIEAAAQLLRTAPARVATPESLPALDGQLSFVYGYVGAEGRLLEFYERQQSQLGGAPVVWSPAFAPVRKTERFKTFARNAGYVDYWRARGWPDLCRPVGADDFECD
jgi:TolB-like protein